MVDGFTVPTATDVDACANKGWCNTVKYRTYGTSIRRYRTYHIDYVRVSKKGTTIRLVIYFKNNMKSVRREMR